MKPLLLASLAAMLSAPSPAGATALAELQGNAPADQPSGAGTPSAVELKPTRYVQEDGLTVYTVPDPRTLGDNPKNVTLAMGETVTVDGKAREKGLENWVKVEVNRQEAGPDQPDGKPSWSNTTGWIKAPNGVPEGLGATIPNGSQIGVPRQGSQLNGCRGAFVDKLRGFVGTDYVWGGTSHKGVDCSGLVVASLMEAGCAQKTPRTAADQQKASTSVSDPKQLQPGDLIFRDHSGPAHHVYVFIGDGQVIEAQQTGTKVNIHPWTADAGKETYGALLQ